MTIANTGDADKDCAYLNTANAIDKAIEIVKRVGRECQFRQFYTKSKSKKNFKNITTQQI